MPPSIPVHTVIQDLGAFTLTMESFCNTQRIPIAYTRLVLHNTQPFSIRDQITLIARTGMEFDLLGIADADGYYPMEPSLNRIKCLSPWICTGNSITDQTYTAFFRAGEGISVSISKDGLDLPQFDFTLEAGADATLYVSFGRNNQNDSFSYEEEKHRALAFWEQELARIKVFPQKEDPFFYTMYRSLVAQGLQMFAYPQGLDYVLMRQGGLQRRIWPTENRSMLEALPEK